MSILAANILFLVCLVQAMYFSLLKIGIVEAAYWFGPKKKIELRNNVFVTPVLLIVFSILHGSVNFGESYFFWELEFSRGSKSGGLQFREIAYPEDCVSSNLQSLEIEIRGASNSGRLQFQEGCNCGRLLSNDFNFGGFSIPGDCVIPGECSCGRLPLREVKFKSSGRGFKFSFRH